MNIDWKRLLKPTPRKALLAILLLILFFGLAFPYTLLASTFLERYCPSYQDIQFGDCKNVFWEFIKHDYMHIYEVGVLLISLYLAASLMFFAYDKFKIKK